MSIVTNIIVTCSLGEEENIVCLCNWFMNEGHGRPVIASEHESGPKVLECEVIVNACNYINIDEFVRLVRCIISWKYPDEVQIFIKEQEDNIFYQKILKETKRNENLLDRPKV